MRPDGPEDQPEEDAPASYPQDGPVSDWSGLGPGSVIVVDDDGAHDE